MKSCNAISGEGNENSEKTTIGLISKKVLCSCCTLFCTFLCRCFARLQRKHSRNFLATSFVKEMSYLLFTFFYCRSPWWPLAFSFSHRRYKIFMLFFQQKMSPLFFISRSSSLSLFFSLSFAGLSPTFSFFSLSLSLSPKFVGMTNNLSLTL